MPVLIVADAELQESPIPDGADLRIPKLTLAAPPQGDSGSVAEAARLLVAAENPVIIAGRAARTPAGLKLLVELAETLQARGDRSAPAHEFPRASSVESNLATPLGHRERRRDPGPGSQRFLWRRPFAQPRSSMASRPLTKPGAKLISITAGDLFTQEQLPGFQRYTEVDLAIAADAEATLPSLIEACKRLIY